MYKIGDYVVKAGNGVCRIDDIMHLDMSGIDRNRWYYLLVPLGDVTGKIYYPVDASSQQMRRVMTHQEAHELIDRVPDIPEISISNDKLREQKYKEVVKSIEPEALLSIIKTTYLRKKGRLEQGKKTTIADENYLNLAEKMLFSELCLVFGKDKNEVHHLIAESVNKRVIG